MKEYEHAFIWKAATHLKILDVIEALMGPDLVLLATHIFCKYPTADMGNEAFVAWHQDATYWGIEPPNVMTAWLAIDDSDEENGAMQVLPGTHRQGILDHGKSDRKDNLLSVNQAIDPSNFDESTAVTLTLNAGQISLHHGLAVHGSLPNCSNRRRCGMTLRYTTPDVKFVPRDDQLFEWKTVLVRGEDHFGNLALLPAPEF
jgi:ectoine hydroxylase-related dioxygenase (phytanoyl-CoA dioxygenase family)